LARLSRKSYGPTYSTVLPAALDGLISRAALASRRIATVKLDAGELGDAIMACRALAYQEGERAKTMSNPDMRRGFEQAAQRYRALATKLEAVAKRRK
jgi:hypothetical protein